MKIVKEIFKTLIASVIILMIALVIILTVRFIAQTYTTLLAVIEIIILLCAGYFFQKIFSKAYKGD